MTDTARRPQLPIGTCVTLLPSNTCYQITGMAIGFGGGSILYPAERLIGSGENLASDDLNYVIKECFPVSADYVFTRNENGEIVPQNPSERSMNYLAGAKRMQLREKEISQVIYRTSARMLPIRDSAEKILLTIPGKESKEINNTITVMDSLAGKGQSIRSVIEYQRNFSAVVVFRIIQQLLFALKEVHQAGYLHLDIQDGNIFLHGSLAQHSELTTLIDFGSARKLTGGKTEPVADRVIFTSEGFTAPEMLLHNDGTLQLGPEADIFSAACLAYYLLTGRRANLARIITEKTGKILKWTQLSRMKCPKHLVDSIQKILAKALQEKPEDRYHSADEMLAEVTELINALQPYRTDLANVKYDAFICYKHGDIDSTAARTLQKNLENFRAPKSVCPSRKPFHKVFLDEGELSSCADFGQQIREALKNAGWLIVVCSPETPSSPWVQNEIRTFLDYHDRSRILAVLTDGEPEQSFPPQLLGGSAEAGEVLAADARGTDLAEIQKKLRGDALLKLTAPMLGVTFDSLKQRQRTYFYQRAAIAAGIAGILMTGFAGFAWNRAIVIQAQSREISEKAQEIQIKNAVNMAALSSAELNDNNRLKALALAKEAASQSKGNVPPEAESALIRALNPYDNDGRRYSSGYNVTAEFSCTAEISDFCPSKSTSFLYAYDALNVLYCWNVETYTPQFSICFDKKIKKISAIQEDILVATDAEIMRIQPDGTVLWVRHDERTSNWVLSNDDELLAFTVSWPAPIIQVINCEDGTEAVSVIISDAVGNDYNGIDTISWGANSSSLFVALTKQYNELSSDDSIDRFLYRYDLYSGDITYLKTCTGAYIQLFSLDNRDVFAVYANYSEPGERYKTITNAAFSIECISSSGEVRWRESFDAQVSLGRPWFAKINIDPQDDASTCFFIANTNYYRVYDIEGKNIYSTTLPTEIVGAYRHSDGNGIGLIGQNGIFYDGFSEDDIIPLKCFPEKLQKATRLGEYGYVSIQDDNRILLYEIGESHVQNQPFDGSTPFRSIDDTWVAADDYAAFGSTSDDSYMLQIVHGSQPANTIPLPDIERFSDVRFLDSDGSSGVLYLLDASKNTLYTYDLIGGELHSQNFDFPFSVRYLNEVVSQDGIMMIWRVKDYMTKTSMLLLYDLPNDSVLVSPEIHEQEIDYVWPSEDGMQIVIAAGTTYYLYDVVNEAIKPLNITRYQEALMDFKDPLRICWKVDSSGFAIAESNDIYLFDAEGILQYQISSNIGRICFAEFIPDQSKLMIVNSEGLMSIIDFPTGITTATQWIGAYLQKNPQLTIMPDGKWALQTGTGVYETKLIVLDKDSFQPIYSVASCYGIRPDLNVFCRFVKTSEEIRPSYTPIYSIDELLDMATEALRDYTLPEGTIH